MSASDVAALDGPVELEILTGPDAGAVLQPLWQEFGAWVAGRLADDFGLLFGPADLDRHHTAFAAEFPKLLAPPGALMVARVAGTPVGSGALKPVGPRAGELKRIFVTPAARGRGVARAVVEALLGRARAQGFTCVRLESLAFMTEAQALYRSVGFTDSEIFEGAEAGMTPLLIPVSRYLELSL